MNRTSALLISGILAVASFGTSEQSLAATTTFQLPQLLYDVDFNSDVAGTPVITSQPPNGAGVYEHPSAQVFGETLALTSYKGLTDKPARFYPQQGGYQYGQLQFETQSFFDSFSPTLTRRIEIQFDLLLENLAVGNLVPQLDGSEDFFTVLLDTKSVGGPASARIDFNGLDGIYFYPTGGPSIKFGTYTPSLAQHYSVINYLDENRIEVWQDGVRIYSDRFHYGLDQKLPLSMKGYRLNLTDGRSSALSPVAVIDNLAVRFVPEPGPAGLMALSCAGYLGFCRRRDRKSREYDRASTR